VQDGTNENEDWVNVYEESFPPDQRQNLDELRTQLGTGLMELDETRDQDESDANSRAAQKLDFSCKSLTWRPEQQVLSPG
jgi:hypothetical protein